MTPARPLATVTPAASSTPVRPAAPVTVQENRYTVELHNSKDGRGPDYDGTFAAMLAMFRSAPSAPSATAPAGSISTPTPTAGTSGFTISGTPVPGATVEAADRRVTVRLAPRRPRVVDADLAQARDQANMLIGEPVLLRWKDTTWTVTRDELADMLRYQPGPGGRLTAYLTRDGLIAKANAIAREANRRSDAPRASDGSLLPLDVNATAGVLWQLASTLSRGRVGEILWTEEVIAPAPEVTDDFSIIGASLPAPAGVGLPR